MSVASASLAKPRLGLRRHLGLSVGWFGFNFHWLPIGLVLIQSQIRSLVPASQEGVAIGFVVACGGVLGVLTPPLAGALSDRLHTRWGRRRPIYVVGLVVGVAGLAVMATARSYPQLALGYVLIQLFNNGANAAYVGMIPDVIPDDEYGLASGLLAGMNNLGGIAGVAVAFVLASLHLVLLTYAAIAIVVLLTIPPVVWAASGEGSRPVPRRHLTRGESVREFFRPLFRGDFAWVVFTRLMVQAGITVVAYFLSPFFRDVVGVRNPDQFTSLWLLLVFFAAVPFGLGGGRWSDRQGRKIFVYASGGLQIAVAAVFIAFYPHSIPLVIGLGAAYGVAYGLYYAVDFALACDTLPDRSAAAKDMGLFHVAYVLPQTFIPLLGGVVLDAFNRQSPHSGYRALFSLSILFFLLGTFFVSRVRSVR